MQHRTPADELWSPFELHPTLQRVMVTLGAVGIEPVLEARKIHSIPGYRKREFLLLRARMRRSVHVNLAGEAPGVLMACLWDFLAHLPFPPLRNEREWLHIYKYEFNPFREHTIHHQLQRLYLKTLLQLSRCVRLLVVSLLFMVRQQVDEELRRGKLSHGKIDYLLKLTVFYYLKALQWTDSRSRRARVGRVFANLVRNIWLLEPAFTITVATHEVLTGCVGPDQTAWQVVMTSRLQEYDWLPAESRWDLQQRDEEAEAKKYWTLDDVLPLDWQGWLGWLPYCTFFRFFRCARSGVKTRQPTASVSRSTLASERPQDAAKPKEDNM